MAAVFAVFRCAAVVFLMSHMHALENKNMAHWSGQHSSAQHHRTASFGDRAQFTRHSSQFKGSARLCETRGDTRTAQGRPQRPGANTRMQNATSVDIARTKTQTLTGRAHYTRASNGYTAILSDSERSLHNAQPQPQDVPTQRTQCTTRLH